MASNYEQEQRFSLKHFPSLARAAAVGWNKDDPWRLSAVIVYYAILSLPGLLVMSFVISATLSALQDVIGQWFPELYYYVALGLNTIISIGVITVLFAMIFKYLPDIHIKWKSVWIGAIITSVLFTIGKELLSFYFGEASPESIYGAAGSIIIVMLWV